jgi:hypothetical protein
MLRSRFSNPLPDSGGMIIGYVDPTTAPAVAGALASARLLIIVDFPVLFHVPAFFVRVHGAAPDAVCIVNKSMMILLRPFRHHDWHNPPTLLCHFAQQRNSRYMYVFLLLISPTSG